MSIIQFPGRTAQKQMRRQTIDELFETGPMPAKGDYVFTITYMTDDGGCTISSPGNGEVHRVIVDPFRKYITFEFADAQFTTARGNASIRWYQA